LVPELDIAVVETRDTVYGAAPPNAEVTLVVTSPGGQAIQRTVAVGPTGRFSEDLGGEVDIGPGWLVEANMTVGAGVTVRTRDVVSQVRLWVHDLTVSGFTAPWAVVRGRLFSADDNLKGTGVSTADADGAFQFNLKPSGEWPASHIEPGDLVDIELLEGDPLLFAVPEITASTDPDAETVSGRAPPGSAVLVTLRDDTLPVSRTVTADALGEYVASFAGELDIEPPMSGTVVVPGPVRHEFLIGWAVIGIGLTSARESGGSVSASGAQGREARIEIEDAKGVLFFAAEGRTRSLGREGARTGLGADLVDETGQPVPLRVGDVVKAVVGDDTAEFAVPELNAAIHVAENRVVGSTAPSCNIEIQATSHFTREGATAEVVSDDLGFFSHDFTGDLELTYGSMVWITVNVGRHLVAYRPWGPGLVLDLDQATVLGAVEANVDITVSLYAGEQVRASTTATTDVSGLFEVDLRDARGEPVAPEPGDRLLVSSPDAQFDREVSMTVPELTLEPDAASDTVSGRATPGGRLGFYAEDVFPWPVEVTVRTVTSSRLRPTLNQAGAFGESIGCRLVTESCERGTHPSPMWSTVALVYVATANPGPPSKWPPKTTKGWWSVRLED
jgi:hypothetical protein